MASRKPVSPPQAPAHRRLLAFKLIAISIPLLLLGIVELGLRLGGYGHNYSLFIHAPENDDYWVMNPYAGWKYFADSSEATEGYAERFAVEKPANTIRLFVLGESTTVGYPYFHNGSFHRWLQYRLMQVYPRLHFEVINLSLTAVSSYTVVDFGKEVLHYSPDAILVYAGHNEYYGALGVGSSSHLASTPWLTRTLLTLRNLRLVQWLGSIFTSHPQHDDRNNLMQRMAAEQEIPYNSKAYRAGVEQYARNMEDLSDACSEAKVPLYLGNLISNERDLAPFISNGAEGDSSASSLFRDAVSLDSAHRYPLALTAYISAKDHDELRFRAPSSMDSILAQLASRHAGVHLVDIESGFRDHSPGAIIGRETVLEHVHPNLYGYALMSDAYYKALSKTGVLPAPETTFSFNDLLATMPVTKIDSLVGAYRIMMLKTGWPFNQPIPNAWVIGNTPEERIAGKLALNRIDWLDAMQKIFLYYQHNGDQTNARKIAEGVLLEHPELKNR